MVTRHNAIGQHVKRRIFARSTHEIYAASFFELIYQTILRLFQTPFLPHSLLTFLRAFVVTVLLFFVAIMAITLSVAMYWLASKIAKTTENVKEMAINFFLLLIFTQALLFF